MKKLLSIVFIFSWIMTYSNQIEVCKTCDTNTIKDAVLLAENGDTLFIKKGVYKENNIEINKSLTLLGEEGTVIDGTNSGTILLVTSNNFHLKNIKIINVGVSYTKDFAAVKISRINNFSIENVRLDQIFFGFLIEKSHNGVIKNNLITGTAKDEASSGNGIHIWHSSNMKISENEIYGMRDGIYFEFVKKSEIFNNKSHDNVRYGLHFMFSNNDSYHNNIFKDNGAGVAVMFSKFIVMHNNQFLHNWGSASYGLLLKEIYDAEIYDNLFQENTIGLNAEGCTRINYTNNIYLRNGWGVKIAGACYANVFVKNDFMHNSFDLAYNTKMNDNRFENNYWSEYTGYDLDKNGIGDIPYRPVKLFSYIVNRTPETLVLLRSLFVDIINFSEKVSPVFTPDNLMDMNPVMQQIND